MKGTISVEHILPQEWKWDWVKEKEADQKALTDQINGCINGIGNLLLIGPEENTRQGNRHPAEKKYPDYGVSYKEHNENKGNAWRESSEWEKIIRNRGQKIFEFMLENLVGKPAPENQIGQSAGDTGPNPAAGVGNSNVAP